MAPEQETTPGWVLDRVTAAQSFLLTGTRGGPTRAQIIEALADETHTIQELATTLGANTETLQKHLAVLEDNNMVETYRRPDNTKFVLADEIPVSIK